MKHCMPCCLPLATGNTLEFRKYISDRGAKPGLQPHAFRCHHAHSFQRSCRPLACADGLRPPDHSKIMRFAIMEVLDHLWQFLEQVSVHKFPDHHWVQARQQLDSHNPEGESVGACADLAAVDILWWHVRAGAADLGKRTQRINRMRDPTDTFNTQQ